jgi:hypothetical protein
VLAHTGAARTTVEQLTLHPVRGLLYAGWLASLVWFAWMLLARRRPGEYHSRAS